MFSSFAGTVGLRRTGAGGLRFKIASVITPRALASERHRPRGHLVKDHAERKNIRARVQRFRSHLFRRHVRCRTNRAARAGKVIRVRKQRSLAGDTTPGAP
jgi:hypothetical protein